MTLEHYLIGAALVFFFNIVIWAGCQKFSWYNMIRTVVVSMFIALAWLPIATVISVLCIGCIFYLFGSILGDTCDD